MKVNISRKKSGLKYAPKLHKGRDWIWFEFRYIRVEGEIHPKYRKLRPIELNEGLFF